MAITPKRDDECSSVNVRLCDVAKKIVLAKQQELKENGFPKPGKAKAIVQIILGR